MSTASRPQKGPAKTSTPPKKKRQQLLISRFFGPKPTSATKSIPKPKPKSPSPQSQPQSQPTSKNTASELNSAPGDADSNTTPVKTRSKRKLQPELDDEIQVGMSPLVSSISSAEPKTPERDPTPRKRRRLRVMIEEDADSEPEIDIKKSDGKTQDDPDFDVADEDMKEEEVEADELEMEVIPEDEPQEESDEEEIDCVERKKGTSKRSGITLASYSLENVQEGQALPRDPRRRERFTKKIGRLEKNSFFLRRTGGGQGEEKDASSKRKPTKAVKYTPLESQYVKVRQQNPGMLLVVECGYKYRMFDEDAATASKILRVAAYFDHNFLTASFPTVRLAHHVGRLVHAGHKVGVVKQIETAALKKASDKSSKLFERKLTAVYTKGTLMADGELSAVALGAGGSTSATSATYIVAISDVTDESDNGPDPQVQKIAFGAVDSATGEVFFDLFDDDVLRSDLESRLVSLEPVEILMPKKLSSARTELAVKSYVDNTSARLERMKDSSFAPNSELTHMNQSVKRSYGASEKNTSPVLSCLGALVQYLKQFGLQLSMSNAIEFKSLTTRQQMSLGADVLRNFEVFGNSNNGGIEGSLIGILNRTKTAFGSRQMRQWLSHPLVNPVDISQRLDTVEFLSDFVEAGEADNAVNLDDNLAQGVKIKRNVSKLIDGLSGLPDLEKGLTRIACRKCTPSEFLGVIKAFEGVGSLLDRLKGTAKDGDVPHLLSKLIASTPRVMDLLNGKILEVLNRKAAGEDRRYSLFQNDIPVDEVLGEPEYSEFLELVSELDEANERVRQAEKAMDVLLSKLKKKHGFVKWEWKKVAVEEFLLEVPTSRASSVPHSWPIICQTKAVKRFRPPEAANGYDSLLCSRETRDAVSTRCWQMYLELFAGVATELRAVLRTLTNLDCLSALARVAKFPGYIKPKIECDAQIPAGLEALQARHPLTETLASCRAYVPNDIHLGRGKNELAVVISGPNYGGKSSYTRMTALLAIMSQVGSYVPASSATLSPFDSIFARMGATDSIAKGMSSLMVELAETSRILSNATSRSLVVLDELGRGTSTHDGTAIAFATLKHLVKETKCVTMSVTHYPVLASLTKEFPGKVSAHYMDYHEEKEDTRMENQDADSDKRNGENSDFRHRSTKITFLYKLTRGVASTSYGLNVARLAGIPSEVISHAGEKASILEKHLARESIKRSFVRMMSDGVG